MRTRRSKLRTVFRLLAVALALTLNAASQLAAAAEPQQTTTFTEPTTIGPEDFTYDGHSIVVDGTVLTLAGEHRFADVKVINGGVIVQPVASEQGALHTLTASRIEVSADSRIDVSGQGLGPVGVGSQSGGSYGGQGGGYGSNVANAPYGSVTAPVDVGTGGHGGRRGGGALRLIADALQLDGQLLADGGNGAGGSAQGGGSGGSLWLEVGTLTGGGLIRAAGGSGGLNSSGGGGGRIALYYADASGFELSRVTAAGGAGYSSNSSFQGGAAGTVYLHDRTQAHTTLRIDNGGTWRWTADSPYALVPADELVVRNAVGTFHGQTPGQLLQLDASDVLFDGELRFTTVRVINGAVLGHVTSSSQPEAPATLRAEKVLVDADSRIDVSGRGLGPVGVGERSGGSYGGQGGYGSNVANAPYGSVTAPVHVGTGGHGGSRGGGALRLIADELQLDGQLLADGETSWDAYVGGGSGGSLWLEVGTLSGGGAIRAAGEMGGQGASGGGGGRIALYYADASGFDLSQVTAPGSASPVDSGRGQDGAAGTVYLHDQTQAHTTLRIDNGGTWRWTADSPYALVPADELVVRNAVGTFHGQTPGQLLQLDASDVLFDGELRFTTVRVINGAVLGHVTSSSQPEATATLRAEKVLVDADSRIDVSGRGLGPVGVGERSGGSYGGQGGGYGSNVANAPYGSVTAPVDVGTGGYGSTRGGGALRLIADALQLDGQLLADGAAGGSGYQGGGSGGSLWLEVGRLSGGGAIRAAGGRGYQGGGGGGGRIAVYYGVATGFDLERITTPGGSGYSSSYGDGEPGTVYLSNGAYPTRVLRHQPDGFAREPITEITLYFSKLLDPDSVSVADVTVTGPQTPVIKDVSVLPDGATVRIHFQEPLEQDGTYSFSIGPNIVSIRGQMMDQDADGIPGEAVDDVYQADIVLDTAPPGAPTVDELLPAPEVNYLRTRQLELSGRRPDESAIWINGKQATPLEEGAWSYTLELAEGRTELMLEARDAAGNSSKPVELIVVADTKAPVISSVEPILGSHVNVAPEQIRITHDETGSGIDMDASRLEISRDGRALSGRWSDEADGLAFTPDIVFIEGQYEIAVELIDRAGNPAAQPIAGNFVLDQTPPVSPVLEPLPAATVSPSVQASGSKEAGSGIWVNGEQLLAPDEATTWQVTIALETGDNRLAFVAQDRAGNQSQPVVADIYFDNLPPGPVALTANGEGSGTTVALDWSGYDEQANGGDIKAYLVLISTAAFSDTAGATLLATLPPGTTSYVANDLTRGQGYFFAVVAKDTLDNYLSSVTAIPATPTDIVPPADAANLRVDSFADRLLLRWTAPADADLAGYRLAVDGDNTDLPTDIVQYELSGLEPATGYAITLRAVDGDDNASPGVSVTGVTLLPNPTGIVTRPLNGMVELTWAPVVPAQYLDRYALYVADQAFSTIEGMTPRATVPAGTTTGRVAGLTNDTEYHFAVTAVNLSGGETQTVVSVAETPEPDRVGPTLSGLSYGGSLLADGAVLSRSAALSVKAEDPIGVARVEFHVDGQLLATDTSSHGSYGTPWDITVLEDGPHTLAVRAYDTLDNLTELALSVQIALAAPEAPSITAPADGLTTNQALIDVGGQASADAEVQLYLNGASIGELLPVDAQGRFTGRITLAEGANSIQATARNRSGESAHSTAVAVTLDSSIPDAPQGVTATAREGGEVRLSWLAVEGAKHYDVYRHTAEFADPAGATRINGNPIAGTASTDLPAADDTYYYRIVAVNEAGTAGTPSAQVSAVVDTTAPEAIRIAYLPQGPVDASGRIGVGAVDVQILVSEPLLTNPFLSITPESGVPLSVDLRPVSETEYQGRFTITEDTPSGTAYAVFSARDRVGNRGTNVAEGRELQIDTDGPEVAVIEIVPSHPVRNDEANPATVAVTIELTEAPAMQPSFAYSVGSRSSVPVDNLLQTGALRWRGTFVLPADAGLDEPELLSFQFSGRDSVDNIGTRIRGDNAFQVYQGELPPLDVPAGLTAKALAGGRIELNWQMVEEAADYQIYRQAPGEAALTELGRRAGTTTHVDQTSVDGTYLYAVASIRTENGQETLSPQSEPVEAQADATAPATPAGLQLELVSQGIKVVWQPVAEADITYRLYRAAADILSTDDLTPIQAQLAQALALDATPSDAEHTYAVTAVDAAGNESPPSESVYLNFDLLPVGTLEVVQEGEAKPELSWSHNGSTVAGYRLFLGAAGSGLPLGTDPYHATSYTDAGYTGDERTYTVLALDTNGVESLPRSLLLPKLSATLSGEGRLLRGVMNPLQYHVTNLGQSAVQGLRLTADVGGHASTSSSFDLQAGEARLVEVIIGGHANLNDVSTLVTTLDVQPNPGERARIVRSSQLPVGEAGLVLSLATQEFTRGATGKVQFTLENTGAAPIEILTARQSGKQVSDQIRYKLLDTDGNVLAVQAFRQGVGTGVVTLPDGRTVARIAPGANFRSDWIELAVPAAVPDQVRLVLEVDRIHYHLGRDDEVSIQGPTSSRDVAIVDTSYYAEFLGATPSSSFGDQPVVISGRAVDRSSESALSGVPVRLIIERDGFERRYEVFTDHTGGFQYSFQPLSGESGVYHVSVVHPDMLDRPQQGRFVVGRLLLSPAIADLNIAYDNPQAIPVTVRAGAGTQASDVHFVLREAAPEGVAVALPPPVSLSAGESRKLDVVVTGATGAAPTGTLQLDLFSSESGSQRLGTLTVRYRLSDAVPTLTFTPSHIETGVAYDDSVAESLTLGNTGLTALRNVRVSLLDGQGNPPPGWVYLTSPAAVGDLAVGGSRTVQIAAAPTTAVAEGIHNFKLRIEADNHPTRDVNVYVSVVQDGIGSVLFKVSDIYTATLGADGKLIQGLQGARIRVQNELVASVEATLTTDAAGEALFRDLPAGSYRYRATASNHQEASGRFRIKPAVTETAEVFLDYTLVSVQWSVTEITIQDRYEILLNATYETDVPAAVVVAEPMGVNLPRMQAGDVFQGEIRLTNHGLVRADNLDVRLPPSDQYFRFELMEGLPQSLDAKDSITVPYRIVMLQSFEPGGDASGGGCYSYQVCGRANYNYQCANDSVTNGAAQYCWFHSWGSCSTGSGGGGGGIWFGGGGGGGGGGYGGWGGWGGGASYQSLDGLQCVPPPTECETCQAPGHGAGG